MSLYFLVLILSGFFPFILSFDRKVSFYKKWGYVLPAILLTGAFFILIDIIFTGNGIWGFNRRYISGAALAGLPVEEWLFFLIIPYCCLFLHYVYLRYSGSYSISDSKVRMISIIIVIAMIISIAVNQGKTYTFVYSLITALLVLAALFLKSRMLNTFYISFLIMIIPFLMVNAILTGTFIEEEVVWYNNAEIMGFRILTIPVEDILYAFSLVGSALLIAEKLDRRYTERQ